MKAKSSVQTRCEYCYIVRREGIVRNYCKRNRRHNQKQGRGYPQNVKRSKKAR